MPATWKRIITTADDSNYKNSNVSTFSGNYNDLSNKPTIPTNNNQLTNGRGFTTNVGDITNVSAGTGLSGGGSSGSVTLNLSIPNQHITGAMIADETITDNQLAEDAVSNDIIESGGVIDGKLDSNCVNASNIKSNAVTTAKIASGAVTNAKIANDAIRVGQIDTSNSSSVGYYLQASPTTQGLTWVALQISNNNWNGTDLSVANGGTGASSASSARGKNNLDVHQAGHFGYSDRIKVLPSDFMQDSDNSTANYAMTSANNGGTGRIMSSLLEIIGNWNIPKGFKATSVTLYGTSRSFAVYECNITNTTATSKGTGTMSTSGGTSNITDVTASDTNYLSIRIDLASTNDRFYGGYISITRA